MICPTSMTDFKSLATSSAELGMPYGLPALQASEADVIKTWLQSGSPGPKHEIEMSAVARKQVREWEEFLNEGKLKQKRRRICTNFVLAIDFPKKHQDFSAWFVQKT